MKDQKCTQWLVRADNSSLGSAGLLVKSDYQTFQITQASVLCPPMYAIVFQKSSVRLTIAESYISS